MWHAATATCLSNNSQSTVETTQCSAPEASLLRWLRTVCAMRKLFTQIRKNLPHSYIGPFRERTVKCKNGFSIYRSNGKGQVFSYWLLWTDYYTSTKRVINWTLARYAGACCRSVMSVMLNNGNGIALTSIFRVRWRVDMSCSPSLADKWSCWSCQFV